MNELDPNNLRKLLDEYERYVDSLGAGAQRDGIAAEIRAAVAEARAGLRPSRDSTANFLDVRQIIERLAALRAKAERLP
jgi:hypothetical protein